MIDVKHSSPMKLLKEYKYLYPEAMKFIDGIAMAPEFKDMWPHEYVYAPIGAGVTYAANFKQGLQAARDGMILTCLSAWRRAKVIYDFDSALTATLYAQAKNNIQLDTSMLTLPAYSIYIRPNDGRSYDGIFVFLDYDNDKFELRFLVVDKKGRPQEQFYLIFPANETASLDEIIEEQAKIFDTIDIPRAKLKNPLTNGEGLKNVYSSNKLIFTEWMNLILYLSAVNADIKREKTHNFYRTMTIQDIPPEVEILNVGESVGINIKTMRQPVRYEESEPKGGHHKPPIMHIRRAHWHTFLYGERKSKKRLKWLPPIIVNDSGSEITTVINVKSNDIKH